MIYSKRVNYPRGRVDYSPLSVSWLNSWTFL